MAVAAGVAVLCLLALLGVKRRSSGRGPVLFSLTDGTGRLELQRDTFEARVCLLAGLVGILLLLVGNFTACRNAL